MRFLAFRKRLLLFYRQKGGVMKKRKMLSLALAFALIMSLVPVSGLAAEPSVFMDPGAVMQEDAEETAYSRQLQPAQRRSPQQWQIIQVLPPPAR